MNDKKRAHAVHKENWGALGKDLGALCIGNLPGLKKAADWRNVTCKNCLALGPRREG